MNYYFSFTENRLSLHERILNLPNCIDKIVWVIKIPKDTATFISTFRNVQENKYKVTWHQDQLADSLLLQPIADPLTYTYG
jgi:hypothetical protein